VQQKLALARQNRDHYLNLLGRSLSHRANHAARQLARSYQAAMSLYEKALTYEASKGR
jgi:hypothetical protein